MVEIFQIIWSEHMAAERDPFGETSTNQTVDSVPVSLPPKQKKLKGREECDLQEVLPAFQVEALKRTGDSSSILNELPWAIFFWL